MIDSGRPRMRNGLPRIRRLVAKMANVVVQLENLSAVHVSHIGIALAGTPAILLDSLLLTPMDIPALIRASDIGIGVDKPGIANPALAARQPTRTLSVDDRRSNVLRPPIQFDLELGRPNLARQLGGPSPGVGAVEPAHAFPTTESLTRGRDRHRGCAVLAGDRVELLASPPLAVVASAHSSRQDRIGTA